VGRTEKHKYGFSDHSRRLRVIFDAHPKEFIGLKLQQIIFLTGLDKYIGTVCIVQKALDMGPSPFNRKLITSVEEEHWNTNDVQPNRW